jgi:hypothetical protein
VNPKGIGISDVDTAEEKNLWLSPMLRQKLRDGKKEKGWTRPLV